MNANATIRDLAACNGGKLPWYAWPGGYPLFYLDAENGMLCTKCATDNEEWFPPVVAYGIHWEGPPLTCDGCGAAIESAYGDPEKEKAHEG